MAESIHPTETRSTWLDRLGIPSTLAIGYAGLLLFMIGDGVESGYLSAYLVDRGIDIQAVAFLFTVYGVTASIAAWFSGALSDLLGTRRVMFAGLLIWAIAQVGFLLAGIAPNRYPAMLAFYAARGFGYPLFAYGFLVWVTRVTPRERLSSAAGWFWFAFTGGLPTLGTVVAGVLMPRIGAYQTLWAALAIVLVGGVIALLGLVRTPLGGPSEHAREERPITTLLTSVTLAFRVPRVGVAAIVRAINTASQWGFLVFMPIFFTKKLGFEMSAWLNVLTVMFTSNIFCNLAFGLIGDRFGWRRTVATFGGVGTAIATLLMYYVPANAGPAHTQMVMIAAGLYGAMLAGYVPLTALTPWLAPDRRGAAMSVLNLGAGVSVWAGPAVVALFLIPLGEIGVIWIFAILHLISGALAMTLTHKPTEAEQGQSTVPVEA
ncbi:MAG TPA: MFS transporter [Terriglobales bacterium]|nr:MFS transporter [Terriglobales bacterium]